MPKLLTVLGMLCFATHSFGASPRYDFQPGEWYLYEVRTEQRRLGSEVSDRRYIEQVQIWCLRREAGRVLLLLDRIHVEGGVIAPSEGLLVWLDPQGVRWVVPECDHRLPAFDTTLNLLPLLPPVLSSPSDWRSSLDHFGRLWKGKTEAVEGGFKLTMQRLEPESLQNVSQATAGGEVQFDTRLNVVQQLDWQWIEPNLGRDQIQRARLVKRGMREAAWLRARNLEMNRYLQILRSDNAMRVLATKPFNVAEAEYRVPRLWEEMARELNRSQDSPFARLCNSERLRLDSGREKIQFQSLPLANWVGLKAREWTLSSPDGTEIQSEQARRGATFEWFYSASEPISLYAAPLVEALAKSLPADVAVIAYNVDQDPLRAPATIERLQGSWTHVLAPPLMEIESLNALPAFRMIDKDGIVRAAAIGWQSDLTRLPEAVLNDWKP